MYFANMYCYGHDNDLVGITGIRGCMGLIYVGAASIYAVHIPPNTPQEDAVGGKTFADWVKNQEGATGPGHCQLFAFCNGTNRSEVKKVKKALNSPPTILYRINKHLGPKSGGNQAEAAVIMLQRVYATAREPTGCVVWYTSQNKVSWKAGGKAETGQYKQKPAFQGAEIPSDLECHWWMMDEMTTSSTTI
ncbi:MAG: hypothetical protein ACOYOH_28260 [Paracraurococcus sp.]